MYYHAPAPFSKPQEENAPNDQIGVRSVRVAQQSASVVSMVMILWMKMVIESIAEIL